MGAYSPSDLERIALPGFEDGAEQGTAGGIVDGNQRGGAGASQCVGQRIRVTGLRIELEQQNRDWPADPERRQPAAQLLRAQVSTDRLSEHIAGEPAFGVAHGALAHHLQGDDHRRLAAEQPLEIADLTLAASGDQPMAARAIAANGDRHRHGAARERPLLGDEERLARAGRPLGDLGFDQGDRVDREPPFLRMTAELGAAVIE